MNQDLRTYKDIIKFVLAQPGSCPPGGMMPHYLPFEGAQDKKIEKALNAEDALYIFSKYKMAPADKVRLIISILNIQELGDDQC